MTAASAARDVAFGRTLIAGIGNVFLGDDGFGPVVARRLAALSLPPGITAADYGIRGIHLAYELLGGGYDTAILVDCLHRSDAPGTLYLLELDEPRDAEIEEASGDAHALTPDAVLALLRRLGGGPRRVLLVGCEPASLEEGMELSAPVSAAVPAAVEWIRTIVGDEALG